MFDPFEVIWNGYHSALVQSTTAIVESGLASVARVMVAVFTIYVIVCGVMLAFGQMARGEALQRILTAVMVSAVLTPAFYTANIEQFFLTTLPTWIAGAIGGSTPSCRSNSSGFLTR